jgi:hypothetical protein
LRAGTALANFAGQFNDVIFHVRRVFTVRMFRMWFIEMNDLFVHRAGYAQRLARQDFPGSVGVAIDDHRGGRFVRAVPVIVILKIFEHVADVQKRVAIQSDVDECRLHAGEDSSYFSFVDAADECEFFLAFDVNLD